MTAAATTFMTHTAPSACAHRTQCARSLLDNQNILDLIRIKSAGKREVARTVHVAAVGVALAAAASPPKPPPAPLPCR